MEQAKKTAYEIRLLFPLESGITGIIRRFPEAQKAEALIQYKLLGELFSTEDYAPCMVTFRRTEFY